MIGRVTDTHAEPLDARALGRCLALMAIAVLPVVVDRGAIGEVSALHGLAESVNPYWVPSHAALLYLRAPLAVFSASVLVMTPGLLLAIAAGMTRTVEIWILAGLILSIVSVSLVAALAQAIASTPFVDTRFVVLLVAMAVVCAAVASWRVRSPIPVIKPWGGVDNGRSLAVLAAVLYGALVVFSPKFYWDSFNGDGAGAHEAARLLLAQPLPFWPDEAARPWPALVSMLSLFPSSWFMRLFGDVEASVRLPWALLLTTLVAAIAAAAGYGIRRLGASSLAIVAAGVGVYAVTMAFSATFSPYWADIAMPAVQDTLTIVLFTAFVVFFLERETMWMAAAQVLLFVSLPSGMLLTALWIGASIVIRPLRSPATSKAAFILGACTVAAAMGPTLFQMLGLPSGGGEYGPYYFVRSYSLLALTHWDRILYAMVPAGILPFAALFAWRRHDAMGKGMALVAVAWFLINYFRGYAALHHFGPSMVLPIIVFWRLVARAEAHSALLHTAAAVSVVAALVLSLPRNARPHAVSRRIGYTVENRIPGYDRSAAPIFRSLPLFGQVFPDDWDLRVPHSSFGGSAGTWLYYAMHRPDSVGVANYILQPRGDPAPEGARLAASNSFGALYVRSDSLLAAHLATRPPAPGGSPIYAVPRDVLFVTAPSDRVSRFVSVREILERAGIDARAIARRFGPSG